MISNIVDGREHPFRWKKITAIVEPTWHDNIVRDSDQADEPGPDAFSYDVREAISLTDAVIWATSLPIAVTLYLYDLGGGN